MHLPFCERTFLYLIYGARLDMPLPPLRIQYYKDLYARWQNNELFTWNWSIFILSIFGLGSVWMIYRRLYLFSFIHQILVRLLMEYILQGQSIETLNEKTITLIFFTNLVLATVLGFIGNTIHLYWISAWKQKFPDKRIRAGGDLRTIGLYFLIPFFLTSLNVGKFLSLIPLFSLCVCVGAHYYYYEYEHKDH